MILILLSDLAGAPDVETRLDEVKKLSQVRIVVIPLLAYEKCRF